MKRRRWLSHRRQQLLSGRSTTAGNEGLCPHVLALLPVVDSLSASRPTASSGVFTEVQVRTATPKRAYLESRGGCYVLRPGSLQLAIPCAPLPSPHPPAPNGTQWTLHPSPPQCGINTFRAAQIEAQPLLFNLRRTRERPSRRRALDMQRLT